MHNPNAQFSIGIDLGTTHCALSYVDKAASDGDKVVQGVLSVPSSRRLPASRPSLCCHRFCTCPMKAS